MSDTGRAALSIALMVVLIVSLEVLQLQQPLTKINRYSETQASRTTLSSRSLTTITQEAFLGTSESCAADRSYCVDWQETQLTDVAFGGGISMPQGKPVTIASNGTGPTYGIFWVRGLADLPNVSPYYLLVSDDLSNWRMLNERILPPGYEVGDGRNLAVTKHGVILISAGREVGAQNGLIFEASYDYGKSFNIVLNASLTNRASPGDFGRGFWHGVVETGNGTIFAGLYRPQGLVFRSTDLGHTWRQVFNASSAGDWEREIHDIEIDPVHDFIYLATHNNFGSFTNGTMWCSTDYGDHWKLLFSMSSGGVGIDRGILPLSIGFITNEDVEYMILGLDVMIQKVYLFRIEPSGELQIAFDVSMDTSTDFFYTWWIYSISNTQALLLTYDALASPKSGTALYVLSSVGNPRSFSLSSLMRLRSTHLVAFSQMAASQRLHRYTVLVNVDGVGVYLLSFTLAANDVTVAQIPRAQIRSFSIVHPSSSSGSELVARHMNPRNKPTSLNPQPKSENTSSVLEPHLFRPHT